MLGDICSVIVLQWAQEGSLFFLFIPFSKMCLKYKILNLDSWIQLAVFGMSWIMVVTARILSIGSSCNQHNWFFYTYIKKKSKASKCFFYKKWIKTRPLYSTWMYAAKRASNVHTSRSRFSVCAIQIIIRNISVRNIWSCQYELIRTVSLEFN